MTSDPAADARRREGSTAHRSTPDALDFALSFPPGASSPATPCGGVPGSRETAEAAPSVDVLEWEEARHVAGAAATPLPARSVALADSVGRTLAEPLAALTDLPAFDTAAMDGWAVSGPGPWRIVDHQDSVPSDNPTDAPAAGADTSRPEADAADAAGSGSAGPASAAEAPSGPAASTAETSTPTVGVTAGSAAAPLPDGCAVRIATGARMPIGSTAVLRTEHAETGTGHGRLRATRSDPEPGRDIRPRGQECRGGEELLPAGVPISAPVVALAAAAGRDTLSTMPRPSVALFVLGDELLDSGPPRDARVRDALGPLLASWLPALGADVACHQHLPDDQEELRRALGDATAQLIVTTGGTASGPRDFLHPVLAELGARRLVDGVFVRPGRPMLCAELPPVAAARPAAADAPADGAGSPRHLVGLPGNPLAAVAGVLTLVWPLLATLSGLPRPAGVEECLADGVPGHDAGTRLVPVRRGAAGALHPTGYDGPAMLRSLALADGMAVVPGTGVEAGGQVRVLPFGVSGMPGFER